MTSNITTEQLVDITTEDGMPLLWQLDDTSPVYGGGLATTVVLPAGLVVTPPAALTVVGPPGLVVA